MASFSKASILRLETCDSRLQAIAHEVIKKIDFTVLEGHRGKEAQDRAYMEGKSKVKYPFGKHNNLPSKAMDIWPCSIEGKLLDWKDVVAAGRLMGYIQRVAEERDIKLRFGLDWDGDFRTSGLDPGETFLDAPHVELVEEE